MKTTACSDVADYVWLTGDEARTILFELADDHRPLHTLVSDLRSRISPERTHLLLEQLELRRRAAAKFAHPEQLFFTRIGLEQATDQWVAAYKAKRFTGEQVVPSSVPGAVADLCCGIGGDLSALARERPTIGVDRDPKTAHFAAVNAGVTVHPIEAQRFQLDGIAALHIDPDRRAVGRRTTSLEVCQPNLETLESIVARVPGAAVKLAPATQVPDDWAKRCELEWISRDRECRQLVAWHGALAQYPSHHRATILTTDRGAATRTITGLPNRPLAVAPRIDRHVFDIDPAVRAARLTGVLAAQHALFGLADGPTYLTGPRPVADPALACFEVLDVLPMELRKLARYLDAHAIGRLEIKKRGVNFDPIMLRRQLKPRGDNAATLLITRAEGRTVAIVARRMPSAAA